jgi:hypothetical protein
MKHIVPLYEFINEAKKDITQLASELVEIAAGYVDVDMTPEMNRAQSIEEEDELIDFLDELYTEVADLSGTDAKKFKKEAVDFLKKYGVKVNESAVKESFNFSLGSHQKAATDVIGAIEKNSKFLKENDMAEMLEVLAAALRKTGYLGLEDYK